MPSLLRFPAAGRRRRGFTLLELREGMVLIGLLAALVAPTYFDQIGKSNMQGWWP